MEKDFERETREIQEEVMQYVHDSLDGKIIQGRSMLWAMERFIKDLKETNDSKGKYYFDWYELMKFDRWCKSAKHSKGVLAGQPIEPHVSWLFEFANILCFKERSTGYRRFKEAFIFQARKQGKTQKVALLSSYIAFLSEEQEEVYLAGWSREQSMLAYNEINFQIQRMKLLEDRYSDSYNHIKVKSNGSTIKPLSREAKKFGDGTSPSLAVIDEYANSHETDEIVDVLKSGMVARKNHLTVYITTAGFDLNYPAYNFYEYCKDILDPESDVENDDIFVAIYELDKGDDIKDENNWPKSNPVTSTYEEGLDFIRSELKLALDRPEKMRGFLTKNMNVWVDQKEDGFMSMEKWNKQEVSKEFAEEFLEGANVYFGIDLSSTIDLTSLGWVAVKNGEFLIGQHSYTPEDMFREKIAQDKVRYDVFQERGELTVTEGSVVDYNYLKKDLKDMAKKYGAVKVGFDVYGATYLATELLNEGLEMVEVKQSLMRLSEPTKSFRENIYNGKMYHTGDNLLRWAMNNAVVQEDTNANIKINKGKSRDRVDPVDAIMNAYSLAMYDNQTVDLNSIILADDWSF